MDELNAPLPDFNAKIRSSELIQNFNYKIQEFKNVETQYGVATIASITDHEGNLRDYFLPPSYGTKIRKNYEHPELINCYELSMVSQGTKLIGDYVVPVLEFVYSGTAPLSSC